MWYVPNKSRRSNYQSIKEDEANVSCSSLVRAAEARVGRSMVSANQR